ncbi:MAG: hypothetical protein K9K32_05890 [Halanaerobiales bacterium]|nr:hypothetical protein [Halanaerobiales bacterium]
MKFPLVLRSTYKKLQNDYQELEQIADELEKENYNLEHKIYILKKKHNQEINEITKQVNQVIGKLVNLERIKSSEYHNKRYKFSIEAPCRIYDIFDRTNKSLLTNILSRKVRGAIKKAHKEKGDITYGRR